MLARLSRQIESPPTWLILAIVLAAMQRAWLPVWPTGRVPGMIGAVLVLAGIALLIAAALRFRQARTTILPREAPARLITGGVYRFSRNPIYLADTMILSGLILRWDLGSLPLVAGFVAIITQRFIRGEEAACAAAFGADWHAYAARVRRWI